MRVFLCHSTKDKKQVRRLVRDLEAQGIDVWLDQYEVAVGDTIVEKLQRGIDESDFVAIWLTKRAVTSKWVQREWYTKYHEEIETGRTMVLPLLAENCAVPAFLKAKRYADFRGDYNSGLKDLLSVFARQPVYNATIEFETQDPVYWSIFGCPMTVHVSCESVSGENKIVVLQRVASEEEDVWHLQFERRLDQADRTVRGKVWYGTKTRGNLDYHEVMAGIIPRERKYKGRGARLRLDYGDFLTREVCTVYRDDQWTEGV